jgi:hypothetical protein
VVRYAVRSFELTILQIALAAAARAPEQTLRRILSRKIDGAIWPFAHALNRFTRDKEENKKSLLRALPCSRSVEIANDNRSNTRRIIECLHFLTELTFKEAKIGPPLLDVARARINALLTFTQSAADHWPDFRLPDVMAHSILDNSGPQYSFLKWAFLEGGINGLFHQEGRS